MACFIVPAVEAVVVTAVEKSIGAKETATENTGEGSIKIPLRTKLSWLRNMLWGGVVLLLFEHIWHGEVVPFFPFLTAMSDPVETGVMLSEMASVGVCMALLITAVWLVVSRVADVIVNRKGEGSLKSEV